MWPSEVHFEWRERLANVSEMSDLLPLRLYAEPLARERLGGACFVLPSKHEAEACLVVNETLFHLVDINGVAFFL